MNNSFLFKSLNHKEGNEQMTTPIPEENMLPIAIIVPLEG
jgi:hypothetical protein